MTLQRTTADHPAFRHLVRLLDAHLAVTDEDEHDFYHQYNGLEHIRHVVLAEVDGETVACGAFKEFDAATVEIKRMYTLPEHRGAGIAVAVLEELEAWATALGYRRGVLETGIRQPYAIRLYEKQGYRRMAENYGQYAGVANSVCLEKMLD
ncbi:GNAT family N-acetyltransferase [Neolewinella lacunae]|uniref:GNAT family N-acetyltransferase n=1 Tax=Neolewinella lacunae TaxID=1517758 RepID=A0A923PNK5_9BACT|nr:GNAT family N-acetyltransferase [Neolewinella lacunae]MBC6994966.1 GNAT family N-acetyltransferase [Neolewinella lacunae]MDN3633263.1 GNAT family N-acetyltransferase [Neolewinella lacunae]